MTETLVNIQKLLAEVRQCLLEAQKAFNDQSALLSKTTSELHAALNLAAASSLKRSERDTALTRAEQAEAGAAAMREALKQARVHVQAESNNQLTWSGQLLAAANIIDAALATDAGAAMLERVRRAEEEREWGAATTKALLPYQDRCHRLLRAAQSLHRAWRRDRVSRGCKHGFRSDCQLGCTDYSCELVRADGRSLAAVEADRDAATQQRDEAREALRNLLTVVQHCYPLPSVPDADLYVRTAARILEVKP